MSSTENCCCTNEEEAEAKAAKLVDAILNEGGDVFMDESPVLLPAWYNHNLVENGQAYFARNIFGIMAGKLAGLMGLLTVPTILNILVDTNKSSTPSKAYKRYLDTMLHVIDWYQSDMRNPNSKGRKSVMNVRRLHAAAQANFGKITQRDLAITQFAFLGFTLTKSDVLGLPSEGYQGIIHFWRVIGHLMGIKDKFNLFQGCEMCAVSASKLIVDRVYSPGVEHPPPQYYDMTDALLRGMWPIMPTVVPTSHREFLRRLCGLQPKRLPLFHQLLLNFLLLVHSSLRIPILSYILRPYFNSQFWLTIFFQKMPLSWHSLPSMTYGRRIRFKIMMPLE